MEFELRWIRLAPVTAESLIICVAIFVSCLVQSSSNHERFVDVQRAWGSIGLLEQFAVHDGVRRAKDPELFGPFDVWDGEWWRIPTTAFHHFDLLHLILTLGATWYLGSRLERVWGSFAMGLFLIPAIIVPVMAELSLGHAVQGFSGVVCSILGTLVVLRNFDQRTADRFPKEAGEIGMMAIVVGWIATVTGAMTFPNAAHFTGFFYGATIAWVVGGPLRHVMLLRLSIILAHVWLVPGLFLASHPYWVGRYHWYLAVSARTTQRAEKSLERATECDPTLTGAWLYWSQFADDRGEPLVAWSRITKGLATNPSSLPLMDGTRRLWRHLDSSQRREAAVLLAAVVGDRSETWLNQIRAESPAPFVDSNEKVRKFEEVIDLGEIKLNQKVELPPMDLRPSRKDRQIPMKEPVLNDAAEGETL